MSEQPLLRYGVKEGGGGGGLALLPRPYGEPYLLLLSPWDSDRRAASLPASRRPHHHGQADGDGEGGDGAGAFGSLHAVSASRCRMAAAASAQSLPSTASLRTVGKGRYPSAHRAHHSTQV